MDRLTLIIGGTHQQRTNKARDNKIPYDKCVFISDPHQMKGIEKTPYIIAGDISPELFNEIRIMEKRNN